MNETQQDQADVDSSDLPEILPPHTVGQVPQWTVSLGILLTGMLFLFLPEELTVGPNWLLLVLELSMLTPLWLFHLSGHLLPYKVVRSLSLFVLTLITIALAASVITLVVNLATIKVGDVLLRTAVVLWISNVTLFGLWYWDIDGGGPRKRHEAGHIAADFLFPQQTNGQKWIPQFVDYLFVAFTAATAFSPTDTSPLTRLAKGLMMIEAALSLVIIGILVGRVANIL